jgi:hypothetical protein
MKRRYCSTDGHRSEGAAKKRSLPPGQRPFLSKSVLPPFASAPSAGFRLKAGLTGGGADRDTRGRVRSPRRARRPPLRRKWRHSPECPLRGRGGRGTDLGAERLFCAVGEAVISVARPCLIHRFFLLAIGWRNPYACRHAANVDVGVTAVRSNDRDGARRRMRLAPPRSVVAARRCQCRMFRRARFMSPTCCVKNDATEFVSK